jgi:hypothetical protein
MERTILVPCKFADCRRIDIYTLMVVIKPVKFSLENKGSAGPIGRARLRLVRSWTSRTQIVGSNPARGMAVCLCFSLFFCSV